MQKQLQQSKISIKSVLCVSILIFIISIFSTMSVSSTTVSYDPPSYSSLTPHDPIEITSDSNFTDYGFLGTGTVEDPYLIDGYNITTTSTNGIYITDTTKNFVISNCYVDAGERGIYIINVIDGTATVINNSFWGNIDWDIILYSSGSSTVINNTCSNNGFGAIGLGYSESSTVVNNTCNDKEYGIVLESSSSSTVENNTCSNNIDYGIYLYDSGSSTVANNTCSNNSHGITLESSISLTVENNTCSNNDYGIWLSFSDSCVISYNLLQENAEYGIFLTLWSDNNLIHHNNFVDNNLGETSQARDDCTNNLWYDSATLEGNYWSDWSGTGTYAIDGTAGAIDLYPLDKPVDIDPPLIVNIIHSPSTPTELDSIRINATITDDSGIYNVTLHYRVNGGIWTEVSMTLVSVDIYSVTIGSFAGSDIIEYYISALDNSANYNEAINDNAGLFYSFTVSVVIPEFQMFSLLLLPTISFLFLVLGLVVQQRRKK